MTGSWRCARSTCRAPVGRSAASSRSRRGARSRARPRCSRGTTSSDPRVSIRTATASPSSSGTIPTCPGTPRPSSCCPSHGWPGRLRARPPSRRTAQPGWWRAAPRSRSDSRPGPATVRCDSSRTGGAGGSPMRTRGGPRRPRPPRSRTCAAEFHGPDWVLGQTTMAEVVDGTVVARMTASGRDALVLLVPGRATAAPPRLPQPCVSISALCAHADGLAFIGSTPDAPANVWVWAPDGADPPVASTARRRARARGRRPGRAVHPDGPLRAARARHAVPTDAARDDGSGRTRARRW